MDAPARIRTNMAFWQCPFWTERTESIYALEGREADPPPYPALHEAFMLFRGAGRADVVLTMGARTSLLYGLLCCCTGRPSRQVMTEVFIDARQDGSLFWDIKHRLLRAVARRALGILTNSSAEVETIARRFDLPKERLRYVPLHTTIRNPAYQPVDDGFILSAGRSLRDYNMLVDVARELDLPVVIVCGQHDLRGRSLPGCVTVLREASRDMYLDHLRRCTLVALPLVPTERSTGQVVVLEAMACGKPVVATAVPGTLDWIRSPDDGILLPENDPVAWRRALRSLWDDPVTRERMGRAGVAKTEQHASLETHARAKLDAIEDLRRSWG